MHNRLIPAPHIIHKLLVPGLLGIQLGEGVALVVWSDVESGFLFLAADNEGAADDAVISFAIDRGAAENIFAGGFEAGEESTCGGWGLILGFRGVKRSRESDWRFDVKLEDAIL